MRQLEGSNRFHQNFAAEALRAYNKSQAQPSHAKTAEGASSDVWTLPVQHCRERAVQTAYCDLWQRNNKNTSAQQEVTDLLSSDVDGAQNLRGISAHDAAPGHPQVQRSQSEAGSAVEILKPQQRKNSAPCSSDKEQREKEADTSVPLASSAPRRSGGGVVPMRPTQLLHIVKAALAAKALADIAIARSRSEGDTRLSMAEFLPRFFAYRFGSGDAARQMAAFREGLRAHSGTSSELQSFACIVASRDSPSECEPRAGAVQPFSANDTGHRSDVSACQSADLCLASQGTSADAVAGPGSGSSQVPRWHLPPLSPVSDTSALLHETAGQLAHELLATPGAEALLKAVTRPAFMCSALASMDHGLRIRCLYTCSQEHNGMV